MIPEDWTFIIFRLSVALVAGGVIGWDRERAGKPAGLRTHMLISLGAALFVMATLAAGSADAASRAIQGVAAGVGFLGAGEIVHRSLRGQVGYMPSNLTSAAAIWVSAALGAAAGYGLWKLTFSAAGLTWFTLYVIKKLERHESD
jgi:putative Mg2+ transporter-C (MgtC) family protein